MTVFKSFKDALKGNHAKRLYVLACDSLRKTKLNADIASAELAQLVEPEHVRELCRYYLTHVAEDMSAQGNGGPKHNATQLVCASEDRGQRPAATHHANAPVRPPRQRTDAERRAARSAALVVTNSILDIHRVGDKIAGDIAWGELRTLVHTNAVDAATFLKLGMDHIVNAILMDKCYKHSRVTDHSRLIRDVIKAKQFEQYLEEARAEAPRLLESAMKTVASRIEHRVVGRA